MVVVVTTRLMLATDIPACAAIEAACYPPAVCEGLRFLQHFWERHASTCWTAISSGAIVGYALSLPTSFCQCPLELMGGGEADANTTAETLLKNDTMYLHDIAVAPFARGQGVGGRLFQTVREHATASTKATTITVTAVCGAWDYWERCHGFKNIDPVSAEAKLRLETYPKECGDVRMMQRAL